MLLFLLVNFVAAFKMFTISVPNAILTSFTSVLTPSIYPSDNPVRTIAFIAKFHIFNSIITTVFIALSALVQFFTAAKLDKAWNSLDRSEAFNSILGNSSGIWEGNVHGDDTWEGNITGNNCVNSTSPVECNLPHQLELPLLLQANTLLWSTCTITATTNTNTNTLTITMLVVTYQRNRYSCRRESCLLSS